MYINRAKVYTLILQDDCSRYVAGWGVAEGEQSEVVIESFETATELHGRPEMVLTDQGSAFWAWRGISRFTALLTEMGIEQVAAPHKEWNGKVERLNATLHKELFDVRNFDSVSEMRLAWPSICTGTITSARTRRSPAGCCAGRSLLRAAPGGAGAHPGRPGPG
jgi:transposase InsO family protein